MAAGFQQITDLYDIYNIVQNTMIRYPKDMFIASLREFFAQDSKYHYVSDEWGYPKTPEHTDLPALAGLYDSLTTRVFIGEQDRNEVIYYPAIIVRGGSFRNTPISINRDKYYIEYESVEYFDGYGNRTFVSTPSKYIMSGAWEGLFSIEVKSRGLRERDDLIELIAINFVDLNWDNFYRAGISIKPDLAIGSPTSSDDRNDKLYSQSVDLNIRVEWRKEIPITDFVSIINLCVEFGAGAASGSYGLESPNLQINQIIDD